MKKGMIIVISGPSGVGKGSIIKEIRNRNSTIGLAISVTTRKPRKGEKEGRDYYFISEETFLKKIKNHEFAEWCEVHGHKYGTLKEEIVKYTAVDQHVILEIDVYGAQKIRKLYRNSLAIFIAPPSPRELTRRLTKRDTEHPVDLEKRLKTAYKEMEFMGSYDAVVINTYISQAVEDVILFIKKEFGMENKNGESQFKIVDPTDLDLTQILEKVPNRFLLSVALSKRARQLQEGAKSLIDNNTESLPPVLTALYEMGLGKFNVVVKEKTDEDHEMVEEMEQLIDTEIFEEGDLEEELKQPPKDSRKKTKA